MRPRGGRRRSPLRRERLGDERVRPAVGLGRHPRENDGADALRRLADRVAKVAQPRVGRLAASGDLIDDQARVAARVDPVQSEAARVREACQQRAVLGDVRARRRRSPRRARRAACRRRRRARTRSPPAPGCRATRRRSTAPRTRAAARAAVARVRRPLALARARRSASLLARPRRRSGLRRWGGSHGDDPTSPHRGGPRARRPRERAERRQRHHDCHRRRRCLVSQGQDETRGAVMKVFVAGATGVLGRAARPAARGARPRGGRDDQERIEAGPGAQPGSAPGRGRRARPRRGRPGGGVRRARGDRA